MKTARGRLTDVEAVILTDVIVLLHENNGKLSFVNQDQKSSVIPLHKLIFREKKDSRNSTGIFLISTDRQMPEMYEIVCPSTQSMKEWMAVLEEAVKECPEFVEEDEEEIWQREAAEWKALEDRANKIKNLVENLSLKDQRIWQLCMEKNQLVTELMEVMAQNVATPYLNNAGGDANDGGRPLSTGEIPIHLYEGNHKALEHKLLIHKANEEIQRLQAVLTSGATAPLNRSFPPSGVSGGGGGRSDFMVKNDRLSAPALSPPPPHPSHPPQRAETFSGFDRYGVVETGGAWGGQEGTLSMWGKSLRQKVNMSTNAIHDNEGRVNSLSNLSSGSVRSAGSAHVESGDSDSAIDITSVPKSSSQFNLNFTKDSQENR